VLRNRAAMAYVFGYSSHTWELFGARSWMVAFLSWVLGVAAWRQRPSPTAVATIGALLAMVASVVGADMAVRFDRRRLCILAMLGLGRAGGGDRILQRPALWRGGRVDVALQHADPGRFRRLDHRRVAGGGP